MALTKIGSIGINTGIAFAGVTTIATLNGSDSVLSVGGTVNFVSDVSIGGTVSIAGTLTYEDVTNVDAVGLITARDGINVGSGITLSVDGDIFATGVVTATSFSGNGALLTGVASTENIRTNTNATFLQNINVSGTTTTAGITNTIASGNVIALMDSTNNAQNHRVRINSQGSSSTTALVISNSDQNNQTAFVHENGSALSVRNSQTAGSEPTSGTERLRVEPKGNIKIANNLNVVGTVTATSYNGDGSSLTGISVGISTASAQVSGITTVIDLDKDDIRLDCTGLVTVDTKGGTEGGSHMLRIVNSGISTVTFNSYFKFPSGASPALPTASGAISLISFTVHTQGRVGVASVFLAGASVNFS